MKILGIDPGLSGAVVLLGDGQIEVARDFKKREDITKAILHLGPKCDRAVMEFVSAMPGQGVTSMFSFGKSAGAAESALNAVKLPFIEVTPQRWQSYYRKLFNIPKGEPFNSVTTVKILIPKAAEFLKRKKDHNTADALLLAFWYHIHPDAPSSRRST